MENDIIAKVSLTGMTWNTPPHSFKPAVSLSSKVNPEPALDSSSSNTPSSVAFNTPGLAQNAAANNQLPVLAPPKFISVEGKSYVLSIEEAAGVFMASVPAPPGMSAAGSSAQAAEDNLDAKLDTIA